jgi:AcrR family transcriptional regulator
MFYSSIQEQTRETIRHAVLDAASRLLIERGLGGLSLRQVATEVGCSTTVIYTLFGGKEGLVDALWREGFERLFREEETVSTDAYPLERLAELAHAYRRHALANADYYRLMFGNAVPGFRPSAATLTQSRQTFTVLVETVQDCLDAGLFRAGDPVLIAHALWATVHGVVSLELAGGLDQVDAADLFSLATRTIAAGFMTPETLARFGASNPESTPGGIVS